MLLRSHARQRPVSECEQAAEIGPHNGRTGSRFFQIDVDFSPYLVAVPDFFQPIQAMFDGFHGLASSALMRCSSSYVSTALRQVSTMPASVAVSPGRMSPAETALGMAA
jgi:hypothetical protein